MWTRQGQINLKLLHMYQILGALLYLSEFCTLDGSYISYPLSCTITFLHWQHNFTESRTEGWMIISLSSSPILKYSNCWNIVRGRVQEELLKGNQCARFLLLGKDCLKTFLTSFLGWSHTLMQAILYTIPMAPLDLSSHLALMRGQLFPAIHLPLTPHGAWRQFLLDKNKQRFCYREAVKKIAIHLLFSPARSYSRQVLRSQVCGLE